MVSQWLCISSKCENITDQASPEMWEGLHDNASIIIIYKKMKPGSRGFTGGYIIQPRNS